MWNVGWCWVWWCWICVSAGILVTWNHRRNLDQWSTSLLSPRSLKASPTLNLSRRANPPACSWMWAQVWWWPLRTWQQGRVSRFPQQIRFQHLFFFISASWFRFPLEATGMVKLLRKTIKRDSEEWMPRVFGQSTPLRYSWLWLVMIGYGWLWKPHIP